MNLQLNSKNKLKGSKREKRAVMDIVRIQAYRKLMIVSTRMVAVKMEKLMDLRSILRPDWTEHVKDCMGRGWQIEW